ncbi:hypothetical protein FB451DRAFT_1180347 [Mycena latifolia]|nr:hypothetical protein FB451DRAFT_1180347 [Mycena latifolia]
MSRQLSINAALLATLVPEPDHPRCPHGHFHSGTPYLAARKGGDQERFGQWSWACLPKKNSRKPRCNILQGERLTPQQIKEILPKYLKLVADKPKKAKRPEKKTPLQRALDAVVAAYTSAFPAGTSKSGPLTAEEDEAIAQALKVLNSFYPMDAQAGESAPSTPSKNKGKAKAVPQSTPRPIDGSIATPTRNDKDKAKFQDAASTDRSVATQRKGKEKATLQGVSISHRYRLDIHFNFQMRQSIDRSVATQRTGKEKATLQDAAPTVQADEYDSDEYEIDPTEQCADKYVPGRLIRVVIYTDPGQEPVQQRLRLRSVSNFEFKWFPIARAVNAVSDDGAKCTKFVRYSLSTQTFTEERVLGTLNLKSQGIIILYRAASLDNAQCPGIQNWIDEATASVVPEDSGDEGDDDDDRDDYDSPPSWGAAASSSTTVSPATRKRKLSSSAPSGRRRSSRFLDQEADTLEAEDEEDQRLPKFTRPLEDGERILVEDSEDERILIEDSEDEGISSGVSAQNRGLNSCYCDNHPLTASSSGVSAQNRLQHLPAAAEFVLFRQPFRPVSVLKTEAVVISSKIPHFNDHQQSRSANPDHLPPFALTFHTSVALSPTNHIYILASWARLTTNDRQVPTIFSLLCSHSTFQSLSHLPHPLEHLVDTSDLLGSVMVHPLIEAAIARKASASDKPGKIYGFKIPRYQPHRPKCRRRRSRRAIPRLEVKIGRAKCPTKRRKQWLRKCKGQRQEWMFYWEVPEAAKFEALIHLHFKMAGAWIPPSECDFCGVRHQEKFDYVACGGRTGIVRVVEYYLGRLGWPVIR